MTEATTGTSRRSITGLLRTSSGAVALSLATSFALTPFVVHELGTRKYGTYAALASWLALGALLDVGMKTELGRRIAEARGREDWPLIRRTVAEGSGVLIAVALFALVVGSLLSPLGVSIVLGAASSGVGHPQALLLCLVATFAFSFAGDGWGTAFGGLQRADVLQRAAIALTVVRVVITVVGLLLVKSVWVLAIANAVCAVLGTGYVLWRFRGTLGFSIPRPIFSGRVARSLASVSILMVAAQVSDVVDYNLDRIYVAHFVGPSAAAQFSIGTQLPVALRAAALLPLAALATAVAEMRTSRPAAAVRLFEASARVSITLAAIAVTGIIVLAPGFYALLFGHGFTQSARAAQLLSIATFLNTVSAGWSLWASGSGWYRVIGFAAGCNLVVNATLSFVLTDQIGYEGALIGSLAGNALGATACYVAVRRADPTRAWFVPLRRAILLATCEIAAAYAVALTIAPHGVVAMILTGILIVGGLSAAAIGLGVIEREWIRMLLARGRPVS